jgi:hypothetical protein
MGKWSIHGLHHPQVEMVSSLVSKAMISNPFFFAVPQHNHGSQYHHYVPNQQQQHGLCQLFMIPNPIIVWGFLFSIMNRSYWLVWLVHLLWWFGLTLRFWEAGITFKFPFLNHLDHSFSFSLIHSWNHLNKLWAELALRLPDIRVKV